MIDAPRARGSAPRAIALAFATGIGVSALVAVVGQLVGLVLFLAQGANGPYAPYVRLGALYVELFHHVDVSLRSRAEAGGPPLTVDVGIAMLLVSAAAIAALGVAGRRRARGATGPWTAALVLAMAGGYALVPFVAAFVARGAVTLPTDITLGADSVSIGVSGASAFALPLAIAAAAAAVGALSAAAGPGLSVSADALAAEPTGGDRAGDARPGGDVAIADVVLGGVRGLALGMALSVVGLLVLASVQPSFARAYGAVIAAPDSVKGRLVLGGHATLLLPNQAMWVLVPSMGACDEAVVNAHATPLLCYWRSPTELPVTVAVDAGYASRSPRFRPPSRAYLAFLLVPLLATMGGGIRAAGRAPTTRRRALAGAASGVVFAALAAAAMALSRIDLAATGGFLTRSTLHVSLGPEMARGTALALAWGVAGGTLGGIVSRYVGGTGTTSA